MSGITLDRIAGRPVRQALRVQADIPAWERTQRAREAYRAACTAFSNQELSEADLLAAARALRAAQQGQ